MEYCNKNHSPSWWLRFFCLVIIWWPVTSMADGEMHFILIQLYQPWGECQGEQRRRIELDIQQSLNIDKVGRTETYKLQSDRLLFRRPSVRLETVDCSLMPRLRVESNDGRQWDSVHCNYSHCGYWIARVSVQLSKSYKKNKLSEKCCSNKPIHWTQLSWDFWWILLLCKINLVIKEQFVLMKLRRSISRIVLAGKVCVIWELRVSNDQIFIWKVRRVLVISYWQNNQGNFYFVCVYRLSTYLAG